MKMPRMLVPTVRKSASASLPLQERTNEMPMPSVQGTAQVSVRPA